MAYCRFDSDNNDVTTKQRIRCRRALVSVLVISGMLAAYNVAFQQRVVHSDRLRNENNGCRDLLESGEFENDEWLPHGCTLVNYTFRDVELCARRSTNSWNRIFFVGDSRVREQYLTFVSVVSRRPYVVTAENFHRNHEFRDNDIRLHVMFYWHPLFGEATVSLCRDWLLLNAAFRPSLVIIGTVLWHLKSRKTFKRVSAAYRKTLLKAVPVFHELQRTTDIIWMVQAAVEHRQLYMHDRYIRNEAIDLYNQLAVNILQSESSVYLWWSARQIALHYNRTLYDGVHMLRSRALLIRSQLILNFYCNRFVVNAAADIINMINSSSADDHICCSSSPVIHR